MRKLRGNGERVTKWSSLITNRYSLHTFPSITDIVWACLLDSQRRVLGMLRPIKTQHQEKGHDP